MRTKRLCNVGRKRKWKFRNGNQKPVAWLQEFAGSFMLIQFYDGHQWASADETLDHYADSVGPELRELMRFWTLMCLAYLFRWCIFEVAEFEEAMMTSFYDRMKLVPVKPGEFDIAAAIKYWFGHLDLAVTAATKKRAVGAYKDLKFPVTYYAALRFLTFDTGSPWYMRTDAPGDVADKVIFGLSKVHDEMLPHIQNCPADRSALSMVGSAPTAWWRPHKHKGTAPARSYPSRVRAHRRARGTPKIGRDRRTMPGGLALTQPPCSTASR
jgi:hypothetical protein